MHGEREGVYMEGVGVCVHEERECACMGRGSVCAWGEGGCVYGRGRVCMHGERKGVYIEGVECACMGRGRVCISKGWSVRALEEGVCMHGARKCVCMHGERGCVYGRGGVCEHGEGGVHMEVVECASMERGRL